MNATTRPLALAVAAIEIGFNPNGEEKSCQDNQLLELGAAWSRSRTLPVAVIANIDSRPPLWDANTVCNPPAPAGRSSRCQFNHELPDWNRGYTSPAGLNPTNAVVAFCSTPAPTDCQPFVTEVAQDPHDPSGFCNRRATRPSGVTPTNCTGPRDTPPVPGARSNTVPSATGGQVHNNRFGEPGPRLLCT